MDASDFEIDINDLPELERPLAFPGAGGNELRVEPVLAIVIGIAVYSGGG